MIARSLAAACTLAVTAACTMPETEALPINKGGFRSSSAALLLPSASGPAVFTPPGGVTMPAAGISRACMPQADGLGAACSTF